MASQAPPSQCNIRDVDSNKDPFDCLLRYDCTVRGEPHDVQLEHRDGVWRLMVDGETVITKKHNKSNPLTSAKHTMPFKLKTSLPDGDQNGILYASWLLTQARWSYDLSVNGLDLRPSWARQGQAWSKDVAVEVLGNPETTVTTLVAVADEDPLSRQALSDRVQALEGLAEQPAQVPQALTDRVQALEYFAEQPVKPIYVLEEQFEEIVPSAATTQEPTDNLAELVVALAEPSAELVELLLAPEENPVSDSLALIPDDIPASPSSQSPLLNIATGMNAIMERPSDDDNDGRWAASLPLGCSCSDVCDTRAQGGTEYFVYTCRMSAPTFSPSRGPQRV